MLYFLLTKTRVLQFVRAMWCQRESIYFFFEKKCAFPDGTYRTYATYDLQVERDNAPAPVMQAAPKPMATAWNPRVPSSSVR
jgi:hypothetical protein